MKAWMSSGRAEAFGATDLYQICVAKTMVKMRNDRWDLTTFTDRNIERKRRVKKESYQAAW